MQCQWWLEANHWIRHAYRDMFIIIQCHHHYQPPRLVSQSCICSLLPGRGRGRKALSVFAESLSLPSTHCVMLWRWSTAVVAPLSPCRGEQSWVRPKGDAINEIQICSLNPNLDVMKTFPVRILSECIGIKRVRIILIIPTGWVWCKVGCEL